MIDVKFSRRARLPLGYVAGVAYLYFARPTPRSLLIGGTIALLGVAMRGWAAGHIEKGQRLAVTGPYAHTRNPLYFGSFLIACGFGAAAHPIAALVAGVVFLFVYAPVIAAEREEIAARFPDEYPAVASNVPLFVPRLTPWRGAPRRGRFRFDLYKRHGEWKAALVFVIAMSWLVVRVTLGF